MTKTGFKFGECILFQSHDRGCGTVGFILEQSFPETFDGEREYSVLYRGKNGKPTRDSMVAECWIETYTGYVEAEDTELIRNICKMLDDNTVAVEIPDEN